MYVRIVAFSSVYTYFWLGVGMGTGQESLAITAADDGKAMASIRME